MINKINWSVPVTYINRLQNVLSFLGCPVAQRQNPERVHDGNKSKLAEQWNHILQIKGHKLSTCMLLALCDITKSQHPRRVSLEQGWVIFWI